MRRNLHETSDDISRDLKSRIIRRMFVIPLWNIRKFQSSRIWSSLDQQYLAIKKKYYTAFDQINEFEK